MIVGYPPFNGDNDAQIYNAIQNDEPDFVAEDWEGISPACISLI
jgi:hypothetical protein